MAIPTNGLDFYLPFDADMDEKIHSLTGTLSSSSAATYFMLSSDTAVGKFLRCIKTQGSSSYYLKYPGSESLMQYGTGDFSVSFWLRSPNWSDFTQVVFEKKYNDSYDGFVCYCDGAEPVFNFRLRYSGNNSLDYFTTAYCNTSSFTHWCFVRVGTVGYWYCNGVLDSTTEGNATGNVSSDELFKIGYSASWPSKQAVFDLKALRIYNRALSDSEITELSQEFADEGTSGGTGVVIDGLFLSTSKPTANQKGLLVNNKFFIPFAESSGGDTSAFESDAMAIIGTPTGGGSGGGMTSRNSLYYFPLDTDYKSYGRNSTFELSAKDDDGFVPAHFNFGAKATGNIDVSTIFKSDFTIDFWSKVISASGNGIVNFYYLWMTGAEQPLLYYQFDGNTQYHAINGHSITPDDNWHHFAIVRSGTNVKTYMDGIEILSANVTDDLSLGGVNLDAAQYLQVDGGTINNTSDGYRSTPLTLDELHITDSALWTADFTPPTLANSLT